MATTLDFIAQCLDQRGWTYQVDRAEQQIMTGVKAQNVDHLMILLRLTENGKFLQFIMPQILNLKDHVYKGIAFQTMLHISYGVKMLRFEYDPSDGEVRASIELPLEDATLTTAVFSRCLEGLIQLVDLQAMPRLQAVLATGEDPGDEMASSLTSGLMDLLLEAMPPELQAHLGEALARRQQS